jgi:hypothetical protein
MCDCIEEYNKKLQQMLGSEGKIKTNWRLYADDTLIEYPSGMEFMYHRKKKDGTLEARQRSMPLVPNYCPFCGKPYKTKDDAGETHT